LNTAEPTRRGSHGAREWKTGTILTWQTGHPFIVNRGTMQSRTAITAFGVPDRLEVISAPFRAGPVITNSDPA
jgi:hypothetical protein